MSRSVFWNWKMAGTIAAADGADDIKPAADGKSVTAVWNRWVVVGDNAGVLVDPGLVSEVTWTLQGLAFTDWNR